MADATKTGSRAAGAAETRAADDREPVPERQAELRAAAERNAGAGRPPYDGVAVDTRGELRWIVAEQGWTVDRDEHHAMYRSETPLARADLRGAVMRGANLSGVWLMRADLRGANLIFADLSDAVLVDADLSGVLLGRSILTGSNLGFVNLRGAILSRADVRDATLAYATLEGARLLGADLRGANLLGARMDAATVLGDAALDEHTHLADVVWNGAPLTQIAWGRARRLGDELPEPEGRGWSPAAAERRAARARAAAGAGPRVRAALAVRAYRQLAVALRAQGLNEDADRFSYRAQVLQRGVLRRQGRLGQWLFSSFLDGLAGYGYRPGRSVIAYLVVIGGVAAAYFALAQATAHPLAPDGALVFSVTSFHGRGFFPGFLGVEDAITKLAALEALVGLVIEVSFIATFTQRFFAR